MPDKPIFIRTTVLPGTCDNLSSELNKEIYFMPEFLTERTAYEDFCNQPMVITGREDLIKNIFISKNIFVVSNLEAEVAKYAHNVFGAVKVTYFNGIYEMCQKLNIDYEKVRKSTLISGYINEPHTMVPGPDGKLGYGGKCFPKDVNAFLDFSKDMALFELLKVTKETNEVIRNENI